MLLVGLNEPRGVCLPMRVVAAVGRRQVSIQTPLADVMIEASGSVLGQNEREKQTKPKTHPGPG